MLVLLIGMIVTLLLMIIVRESGSQRKKERIEERQRVAEIAKFKREYPRINAELKMKEEHEEELKKLEDAAIEKYQKGKSDFLSKKYNKDINIKLTYAEENSIRAKVRKDFFSQK